MTFDIEGGVALPPLSRKPGGGRKRKYPLPDLEVGLSFFVPETAGQDIESIRGSLSTVIARMKKSHPARKFETRKWIENGATGIRVWRTE